MGNHIKGDSRIQATFLPPVLDDWLAETHPARVIDEFVNSLDDESLEVNENNDDVGRSSYGPKTMLKILLYAYSIGIRASRKIRRMLEENVALRWLTCNLVPSYRTIARFRRDNINLLTDLLTTTIKLYKEAALEAEGFENVIFIDGTKLEADAASKSTLDMERIRDIAEKILKDAEAKDAEDDEKYGEDESGYELSESSAEQIWGLIRDAGDKVNSELKEAAEEEEVESDAEGDGSKDKSEQERFIKYIHKFERALETYIEEEENNADKKGRVNTTDPDCKFMKDSKRRSLPSYNGQIAVDSNNIIIATDLVNEATDRHQYLPMVDKSLLQLSKVGLYEGSTADEFSFKAVADKGYYETDQLREVLAKNVETIVKNRKEPKTSNKNGSIKKFSRDDFHYDKERNVVICPEGKILRYTKTANYRGKDYNIYYGSKKSCGDCPSRYKCISDRTDLKTPKYYTILKDQAFIEKYNAIIADEANQKLYKERKYRPEPVFGSIKRNLGFKRFSMRGIDRARGEFNLISSIYNLKRIMNLVGIENLLAKMSKN